MKKIDINKFHQKPNALNYSPEQSFHIIVESFFPGDDEGNDPAASFVVFDSATGEKILNVHLLHINDKEGPYQEDSNAGKTWYCDMATIFTDLKDHALVEFLAIACLEPMADMADAASK